MMEKILNIACYHFLPLSQERLSELKPLFKAQALALGVRGTIYLASEGINMFLSAPEQDLNPLIDLISKELDASLWLKKSYSDRHPFRRLHVKIKQETLSFDKQIDVFTDKARYLDPEALHRWVDEGKSFILLDTRNDYEYALGTFKNAITMPLSTFRQFPHEAEAILGQYPSDTPIVTFCTGGIRCEKAAPLLVKMGFTNTYQITGGILNYLEKYGTTAQNLFKGDCFVFDHRVALKSDLSVGDYAMCFDCRMPLNQEQQALDQCVYCGKGRLAS